MDIFRKAGRKFEETKQSVMGEEDEILCEECGEPVPEDVAYCPECGADLTAQSD